MQVDLHTHSIYSDGEYTPRELLEKVRDLGIKYYALTDHDSVEGSKLLLKEDLSDIVVYSGVELSAKVNEGQMHILGYNFDVDNEELNTKLDYLKQCSCENIKGYIEQLKDNYNIVLPKEDLDKLFLSSNIHRPSLARILVKNGYAKDVPDAFDKYLKDSKVKREVEKIAPEECIELIKRAGGVAVLAHPWTLRLNNSDLKKNIEYLVSKGLDGIEVYHSCTSPKLTAFLKDIAKEYDLITTGGTDFHGEHIKPDIKLGSGKNTLNINSDDINIMRKITSRY